MLGFGIMLIWSKRRKFEFNRPSEMALQLYNAANAAAAANQNPVLLIGGQALAQYCHNSLQLALLAMPGNDVAYVRGRITPAQVRTMRSSYINGMLIQSRGILVEGSCGECRRRGLTPFPDCRRVPGHFGNSCGNCKWRDHGIRCVRSDRPRAGPAGRGCRPPPPPRASPDRSPTPPPSAAAKSSGGRKRPLLLGSGSAEEPLIVD
ncbi:hypothetical protein BHYA_0615g00010 [Botrytis hyacinthi]|uniref:Uncharacterized protein n=1 Tax=Botrytis hyacinthi TaxID=278943 RepID=A0A4Z1G7W0_9HELO|nr:hypothetical protein BHYA_0615g00010 [Botrytis hyacinthi]